jgi:hypothetical protein
MAEASLSSPDSGSYQYLLNGEPTAITETWSRLRQACGQVIISSTREAPGITIAVTATANAGLVGNCELSWTTAAGLSIKAEYILQGTALSVVRRQGDGPAERTEIELEESGPLLLSPLMRIYTGPVIAGLLASGGQGTVIVPAIGNPDDESALLRPRISQRQARVLEPWVELDRDGAIAYCRVCKYTGDQYGAGSRFWLAEDETLLRYQWQQAPGQLWDVRLKS